MDPFEKNPKSTTPIVDKLSEQLIEARQQATQFLLEHQTIMLEMEMMSTHAQELRAQLTKATTATSEFQLKHSRQLMQMQFTLQSLREQLTASGVGSSASTCKVVQVDVALDPVQELNQRPVLKATAFVTCTPVDETRVDETRVDETRVDETRVDNTTDDEASASASADASGGPRLRKALTPEQRIAKNERARQKRKLAAQAKVTNPLTGMNREKPADAEQPIPKKPLAGYFLFQHLLLNDDAFALYKIQVQAHKVGSPERGALMRDLYLAYKHGTLVLADAASADKVTSSGKEKMDIDSDVDYQEHQLHEGFDWTRDAIFHELGIVYPFFKEDLLDAKSLWYVNQLTTCRPLLGQWATNKEASFKYMLTTPLITMDGLNELIQGHWLDLLSEPCCWKIKRPLESPAKDGSTFEDVDEWHPHVKTAMRKWESKIHTSSTSDFLERFYEDSALHKCTVADFQKVKKAVDDKITNKEITEWNDFAKELLLLCKKQPGNGNIIRDPTKVQNITLLAQILGEFVPDREIARDRA